MKKINWIKCAGCGNFINEEWGECPLCDSNLGYKIWLSFCRKNNLYSKGVVAGIKRAVK